MTITITPVKGVYVIVSSDMVFDLNSFLILTFTDDSAVINIARGMPQNQCFKIVPIYFE